MRTPALVATDLDGTLVRGDHHDPAVVVSGIVAADRSAAWYVVATVDTTLSQSVGPVRLPGLDPAASYDVVDRTPAGPGHRGGLGTTWLVGVGIVGGMALSLYLIWFRYGTH